MHVYSHSDTLKLWPHCSPLSISKTEIIAITTVSFSCRVAMRVISLKKKKKKDVGILRYCVKKTTEVAEMSLSLLMFRFVYGLQSFQSSASLQANSGGSCRIWLGRMTLLSLHR